MDCGDTWTVTGHHEVGARDQEEALGLMCYVFSLVFNLGNAEGACWYNDGRVDNGYDDYLVSGVIIGRILVMITRPSPKSNAC